MLSLMISKSSMVDEDEKGNNLPRCRGDEMVQIINEILQMTRDRTILVFQISIKSLQSILIFSHKHRSSRVRAHVFSLFFSSFLDVHEYLVSLKSFLLFWGGVSLNKERRFTKLIFNWKQQLLKFLNLDGGPNSLSGQFHLFLQDKEKREKNKIK